MLLRQAVPQFQLWFGTRPEITKELRSLLEQDLMVPQLKSQE
jgi:shikimate 5-dehydrogenase